MQAKPTRGGGVEVRIGALPATLIRSVISNVRDMLEPPPAADPLEELVGMRSQPLAPPEDPALARLLPAAYTEDDDAARWRQRMDDDLRRTKQAAADLLLSQLPEEGGKLRLTEDDAASWLTALNDLRLVLGVRLGISDNPDEMQLPEEGSPQLAMWVVYNLVTDVQGELLDALAGPFDIR
jgi:hypothetical protein